MKKLTQNIFLPLIFGLLTLVFPNLYSAYAQYDDRPIGKIATEVSKNIKRRCETFVDRPENHGATYSSLKYDEDSTITGEIICLFSEATYRHGYQALIYKIVIVDKITQGVTSEETRNNAYIKIREALAQPSKFQKSLSWIRRHDAITPKAGQILTEGLTTWVVQTYALEYYGITPPKN